MTRAAFQSALSFLFDRPWVRLGAPLVLLALAVPFGLGAEGENHGRFGLVGTWNFHAVLDCTPGSVEQPCPFPSNEFIGVETFNRDGTMQVVANIPFVTIGAGVWKQTGHQRYTFSFAFFAPNPAGIDKGLMVPVLVMENLRMIDQDNYITKDIIRIPGVGDFPGTVTATRFPFFDYNQTLP